MIHLTRRESRLAIGMVAVIVVWAVYGFAVKPAQDRITTLQRVIPEKQSDLESLQETSVQYLALAREVQSIQTRITQQDESFELLPFLESLTERQRLGEHLVKMEPATVSTQAGYAETVATIELEAVTLRQLMAFIEAVESADVVARISDLHIRQDRTAEGTLAATLRIVSPRPQAKSSNA